MISKLEISLARLESNRSADSNGSSSVSVYEITHGPLASLFTKVTTSSAIPATSFEAVIAAVHFYLISRHLICVSEAPNSVPGFAAPVRGL